MTATRAATDTCGSGVDPWPSELGEPADLDLLRASLQHLAACYRDLADNNLLATSEVEAVPVPSRRPAPPRRAPTVIRATPPPQAGVLAGRSGDRSSAKAPRAT